MKILILSCFFTPSTSANAKRAFYMARGLLDAGWEVDVIASNRLMPSVREELLIHPNLNIHRIEDPQYLVSQNAKGWLAKVAASALRGVLWPDAYLLWVLRIARRVNVSRYDRILICVMPISMMVLAIFKKVSSRWIFDYSESFSPNVPDYRKSPVVHLLKPFLARLQRRVLSRAGVTLFTSESTRQEYIKHGLVEEGKAKHIPLFYDDFVYKNIPPPKDLFVIGYAGTFGVSREDRSPEVFFEALSLFLKRVPQARKTTRFIFYGRWRDIHTPLIRQSKLEDVITINSAIPYERYVTFLSEAVVLLLVASRAKNLFIPSKMLDYFGAKRPVLAFVPSDSETRAILREARMDDYGSEEDDVEGGAQCLERLWSAWASGQRICEDARVEHWSYSFQMPRILNCFLDENKEG